MNPPPTSDDPLASETQGPPTEWEGTAQAAARVGVSSRKVRYWVEAKRIRARKATQDGREVWLVASSDVTSVAEDERRAPERRSEEASEVVAIEATRAASAALQGFLAHVTDEVNREAEDRRRADDDLRTLLRTSEAKAATEHLRTEEALAAQNRLLTDRIDEVGRQATDALKAAQDALQAQQEAFSQVTAERDALATTVGDLAGRVEALQAELQRAKRPWWQQIIKHRREAQHGGEGR
jgi:uncharacterized protein YhaN